MKFTTTFSVVAMSAVLSTAAIAGPFDGIYRPNSDTAGIWDCQIIGADGGAFAIFGDELFGLENQCKLANPVNITGMDAILYDATCSGEGFIESHRTMILRNDHGVYVISNGYAADWKLCER